MNERDSLSTFSAATHMPTDEDYTEAMRYPVSSMPHSLRSEIGQDLNHMNYTSNTRHCFIIAERILGMTASEIQGIEGSYAVPKLTDQVLRKCCHQNVTVGQLMDVLKSIRREDVLRKIMLSFDAIRENHRRAGAELSYPGPTTEYKRPVMRSNDVTTPKEVRVSSRESSDEDLTSEDTQLLKTTGSKLTKRQDNICHSPGLKLVSRGGIEPLEVNIIKGASSNVDAGILKTNKSVLLDVTLVKDNEPVMSGVITAETPEQMVDNNDIQKLPHVADVTTQNKEGVDNDIDMPSVTQNALIPLKIVVVFAAGIKKHVMDVLHLVTFLENNGFSVHLDNFHEMNRSLDRIKSCIHKADVIIISMSPSLNQLITDNMSPSTNKFVWDLIKYKNSQNMNFQGMIPVYFSEADIKDNSIVPLRNIQYYLWPRDHACLVYKLWEPNDFEEIYREAIRLKSGQQDLQDESDDDVPIDLKEHL